MTIAAGFHFDMSAAEYFADPCAVPSLTQSVAKILLDRSPLHAWHAHPRLNPDWEPDDPTKFDVGNVAHRHMIGRGKEIHVLPPSVSDWRTNAAKEARAAAHASGMLAVLHHKNRLAEKMVSAAREQLDLRSLGSSFRVGAGEVVMVWQEDGIWMRQMIDWLTPDRRTFYDYKTTDMSAAPHTLDRMMFNMGWHVQAAMAERGLNVLDPDNAGRRRYLFVVQETQEPYCLSVVEITESVLTMGRKQLDRAVAIWRHCMLTNRWPGYPTEIIRPEIPSWAEAKWLEREIAEADIPPDVLIAG